MYTSALKKYEKIREVNPEKFDQAAYTKIFQSKIIKNAEKNKLDEKCRGLLEQMKDSARAQVRVDKNIYPGCRVFLDDKVYAAEEAFSHLLIKRYNDNVIVQSIDEE